VSPASTSTALAAPGRRTRGPSSIQTSAEVRVGPVDHLSAEAILARIPALPMWAGVPQRKRNAKLQGAATILAWLQQHPGDGWQQRWLAAGADRDTRWLDELVAEDPRTPATKRDAMTSGLALLLLCQCVLPGYGFLAHYGPMALLRWVRETFRPDLFAQLEQAGRDQGMQPSQAGDGVRAISKMVLHTGRDVDRLTAGDVHEYREWFYLGLRGADRGVHAAWDLLGAIGILPPEGTLRSSLVCGQRSTEELVDAYQIRCQPIREVLIRYLRERRPALDYSSFQGLVIILAGRFWADLECHHSDIDTLQLPPEVATAWKQRLRFVTTANGQRTPRKNYLNVLATVRAFYLDLQEWALEDPTWVPWAASSPVRRADLAGMQKARNKTVSAMHQRVRDRLPHVTVLVDSAEAHMTGQARLLAAAESAALGETFHHDGVAYLRTTYKSYRNDPSTRRADHVLIENLATGEQTNVTETEDDAFWAWAIIETLRHTGVRIEELLELTHLALVSYRLPDTGEILPLLQILPSKSNEERLLLVDPELASVLACLVKRLRDHNNGAIPLVSRYDQREKVTGPPLPHLFQRKIGWRPSVISPTVVKRMLTDALRRAGLCDRIGQPLDYTPHDFRRIFTTQAVTGGLPVHIAAKLLGHHDLATTQSYLAVFQDDLIRTYRSFLDQRRAVRPQAEYREPTDQEWQEFEEHFQLRKLELGTCGRPYGSPCKHEHACIRCPMLRVDPRQRQRLAEIAQNLQDRITEARVKGWHGEAQGLQVSLQAAHSKLASLDRTIQRRPTGTTDLGMPALAIPSKGPARAPLPDPTSNN
jgi:site-specific recombinase XerD